MAIFNGIFDETITEYFCEDCDKNYKLCTCFNNGTKLFKRRLVAYCPEEISIGDHVKKEEFRGDKNQWEAFEVETGEEISSGGKPSTYISDVEESLSGIFKRPEKKFPCYICGKMLDDLYDQNDVWCNICTCHFDVCDEHFEVKGTEEKDWDNYWDAKDSWRCNDCEGMIGLCDYCQKVIPDSDLHSEFKCLNCGENKIVCVNCVDDHLTSKNMGLCSCCNNLKEIDQLAKLEKEKRLKEKEDRRHLMEEKMVAHSHKH